MRVENEVFQAALSGLGSLQMSRLFVDEAIFLSQKLQMFNGHLRPIADLSDEDQAQVVRIWTEARRRT